MNFSKATEATPCKLSTGTCSVDAAPSSSSSCGCFAGVMESPSLDDDDIKTVPNSRGNQAIDSFSKTIVFCKALSKMVASLAAGSFLGP